MKKNILNIITTIALLSTFSESLFAQSTIEGFVKEGTAGTPLTGINITIPGNGATTSSTGFYRFSNVTTGTTITVATSVTGYSGSQRTIVVAPGINQVDFWFNALSDADVNSYGAIEIGTQRWMAENLKTTKYNGGSNIPNVTTDAAWVVLATPAYCWYNNDEEAYKEVYGAMYNWYAVNTGNLCPTGWHVPSQNEWQTLGGYLGNNGGKLKEVGTAHFVSPNTGATNESGFTALPGGVRAFGSPTNGSPDWAAFMHMGHGAEWWCSDNFVNIYGIIISVGYGDTHINTFDPEDYRFGVSVRCVSNLLKATLTTTAASNIGINSAESGGSITGEGTATVTASGVCWSILHNPTISYSHTNDGSGASSFTSSLTGLTPNTTYYVRAYATNSVGTNYGAEVSFSTICPTIIINTTQSNVSCLGTSTGSATATPSGGTGPYSYSWNTAPVQNTATASSLAEGTYTVTVTDANGCTGTTTVNISQPAVLSATVGNTNVTCFGANDGTISIKDPQGGHGTYEYRLDAGPWQAGPQFSFTNLAPANYLVQMRDAAYPSCIVTLNNALTINQATVLSATVGGRNVTCFGANDGTISIKSPAGGHGAYEYSIDGGTTWQASGNFSGLSPKSYNVQIHDATYPTCIVTLDATHIITQPPVLSATATNTDVSCNGTSDGMITITATGGYGTYEYSINGGSTWETDSTYTGLIAGNYMVRIRDLTYPSCMLIINDELGINQPDVLSASVTSTNVTCTGANDGIISITAPIGGYGTYQFSINGGGAWLSSGTFTGLAPASYDVRIRDAAHTNCAIVLNNALVITQPAILSATVTPTMVTCNGANDGIITITAPIGGHGTYEFSINGGGTWLSSGTFTGLTTASYDVRIRDAAYPACVIVLGTQTITQPDVLDALGNVISQSCNRCNDAAINLSVSGGTVPYSFAWTGPDGYSSAAEDPNSLKPGSYNVVVTDAHSCSKKVYAEVINPFVVTNVNDDGIGSLLGAIDHTNVYTNPSFSRDTITFNIPGSGPFKIEPQSPLVLNGPTVIDGYSQQFASFTNLIQVVEINGTNAGAGSNGLTINSNNCTVKGLIIDGFTGNGIQIASGTGNTISANSIFENGERGIDLGTNGAVTPNDEGDSDSGQNNLQNFPVLASLSFSPGNVTVSGSLNSLPTIIPYKLEFFANKVADNTGYGEGQTYLGSSTVTTNSAGNATFTVTLPTMTRYGDVITSTATDPAGNTSEFSDAIGGLQNQILAASNIPFHYKINREAVKNIDNATICNQIKSAFGNWSGIITSSMSFTFDDTTASKYASASDHINLVSFKDDKFPFSPGVLAVTAKTLKIGTNDTEAQILDADIVFNPYYVYNPDYDFGIADNPVYTGFFDIQSITTHEIGHILGLLHSGVYNSTMWFEIGKGVDTRSLEQDDKSWLSYRYPNKAKYDKAYGSISGNIKYGYNDDPVAGAIVLAVNPLSDLAVVHAYSDVNGNYLIPGLPPGSYRVYIMPLDGDVYGRELRPGNISSYIYSNTVYTDYPGEFYNNPDLAVESNVTPTNVTVVAGKETGGINLVTNKDVTSPTVMSVVPAANSTDVSVLPNILITFSEPADMNTLTDQSCYLTKAGSSTKIGGKYQPDGFEDKSDIILFTLPENALGYESDYILHITSDVTDLKGNHLQAEFTSTFRTGAHDLVPPTIKSTIPEKDAENVFLTEKIMVFFSEPMKKSSVESSFVLTTDNGTVKVDCTPGWDGYSTLTLSPKSPLIEGKTYSLLYTNAATDLSGNGLAGGTISFTTIPIAAPTVIYLEPGGSNLIYQVEPGGTYLKTGVDVRTSLVVDFSEPINTTTVNSTTFNLLLGTNQVPGTFEFLNENSRVVFRPAADLIFDQSYSINLTGGIQDVSEVTQNFAGLNTTFTTATKPLKPHIEYIDPPAGVIGSKVIIGGYGFDPDPVKNKVTFTALTASGVDALAISASLNSITVIVPYGAVSGAVRVTSNKVLDDQDPNALSTYLYIISDTDPCNTAYGNVGTGSNPRDGALDYDAANAYVTNSGDNTVSVITNLNTMDPSNNPPYELTPRIQVGTTPMKIDINPTGTRAYVTNFDSRNVSVIDLTDANGTRNQVIKTINVGVNPFGIVANGDRVYVANYGSENISVINVDPTSGGFDHAVANINTGTGNRDIDITPDGGILVVTGDNGLTIIRLMQSELGFNYAVYNANSGTSTRDVAVTADAGTAIVTTMNGDIFFVDIAPGDNFGTAYGNYNPGSNAGDGKITYDGLFYYVTNPDDDKVTVYKITYEGGGSGSGPISSSSGIALKEYATIPVGDSPEGLAIDPDNDRVIVVNSGSSNVTPVYICCPANKTASDLVKDLIYPITEMLNGNDIQSSLGIMLIGKLNDASVNIIRGKTKTAINSLKSFINKVIELDAAGKFPPDNPDIADDLIKIAEKIIYMLEHPGASKSDPEESIISGVNRTRPDMISTSKLGAIYPNPFSQSVTINFEIVENKENPNKVQIMVYDINGRLVSTLVDKMMQSGCYTTSWKGDYDQGGAAPYGTYFVLFRAGAIEEVSKIMLNKPR